MQYISVCVSGKSLVSILLSVWQIGAVAEHNEEMMKLKHCGPWSEYIHIADPSPPLSGSEYIAEPVSPCVGGSKGTAIL